MDPSDQGPNGRSGRRSFSKRYGNTIFGSFVLLCLVFGIYLKIDQLIHLSHLTHQELELYRAVLRPGWTETMPQLEAVGIGPIEDDTKPPDVSPEKVKETTVDRIVEKRQSGNFIVTGVTGTGIRLRQDWYTFEADADLLNLFLCGLEAIQRMNQNTRESYFQMAGIHGAPYVPWDGVSGRFPQWGYCTHASILFPTWHRPYLAAYEQILSNTMRNLANQYPAGPARTRYQAAATRFRLPYWDWARNARVPDIISTVQQVVVEKPQGFVRINNPLYSYIFNPFNPGFFPYPPFNSWTRTLRQPGGNGNSRPDEYNRQLQANQISLRNRVYNILNFQHDFRVFSNKAWNQGNSGNQDSIESIHDLIHGVIGGRGHMAVVDTSAMDPIFMLHHCNIDRLITMWQTLNPNSFTTNQLSLFGTRTNAPGSTEGATSPLTPFRRTPTEFWNSNNVRRHTIFGYTYPELADAGTVPDYRLRTRLRIRINNLYGSTAPQNALRPGTSTRSLENRAMNQPNLVHGQKYHEWAANIRINKFAAEGSFLINVFIGAPSEGIHWTQDPAFVGTYYVFSKNGTCEDCNREAMVTGSVPLTNVLIECAKNGHIIDLTPTYVIPYLKNKITWRVQRADENYLDPGHINSLKVSVAAAEASLAAAHNQAPSIGDWVTYYDITDSKPAGLCYGDPA